MTATATKTATGTIVQVIGPVIDIEFPPQELPELYNALVVKDDSGSINVDLTVEVQQHIGRNQVRTVAMSSTDGVCRGMQVTNTGSAISVPVGAPALGRILNVLGEPVDGGAPIPDSVERWPIHRPAPGFTALESKTEILETGIKVVDLVSPFVKGGKIGLFGGAGRRQDGGDHGVDQQRPEGTRRKVGLLWSWRAHPRRQRPLSGDERVGSHRFLRTGLWPDERAAGCASSCRPIWAHRGGVLP